MKKRSQLISEVILCCLFLLASGIVAVAQEQSGNPDYNWLNGKWRGRTLSDAPFQMDLRVMNDNEVKGSGVWNNRIEGRLKPQTVPIGGIVKDNKVTLDIQFGNGTFKYNFTYVDGNLRLKRKNDEVDFEKVK